MLKRVASFTEHTHNDTKMQIAMVSCVEPPAHIKMDVCINVRPHDNFNSDMRQQFLICLCLASLSSIGLRLLIAHEPQAHMHRRICTCIEDKKPLLVRPFNTIKIDIDLYTIVRHFFHFHFLVCECVSVCGLLKCHTHFNSAAPVSLKHSAVKICID